MSVNRLWLLRLYPPDWRQRYADEYAAVLEQCRLTPRTLWDIVLGALDAHLHAHLVMGRRTSMTQRLRAGEITIFCGYILFVVSGMGFQKMTEDMLKAGVMRSHALLGGAFNAVVAGAVVALLAVLAGGLPLAYAALRYARAAHRRDIMLLFAVPPVGLAVWLGYTYLLLDVVSPAVEGGIHTATGVAIGLSWVGVFALAAICSTWAVSAAIARSEIPERVYRWALGPAAVATLAMVGMLAAVIVWGIGLQAQAPQYFYGNQGILATNTEASWLGHVVVMSVATLIAIAGVVRAATRPRALAAPSS
jgi:hypothetical protein